MPDEIRGKVAEAIEPHTMAAEIKHRDVMDVIDRIWPMLREHIRDEYDRELHQSFAKAFGISAERAPGPLVVGPSVPRRLDHPPVLVAYEDRDDVEPDDRPYDKVQMCDGSWLFVHLGSDCLGEYCAIHQPSDHPLKDAPYNWRGDRLLMERLCEHGCGHPDPDDLAYKKLRFELHEGREATEDDLWAHGVHGCCGCCGAIDKEQEHEPERV